MYCILQLCRNPELESPPIRLEIIDVEKRKGLSNYYVREQPTVVITWPGYEARL